MIWCNFKIKFVWNWFEGVSNQIWKHRPSVIFKWSRIIWRSRIYSRKICISSIWKFWSDTKSSIILIQNSFITFFRVYIIFYKKSKWKIWSLLWWIQFISRFHRRNDSSSFGYVSIWTINRISIICPTNNRRMFCW